MLILGLTCDQTFLSASPPSMLFGCSLHEETTNGHSIGEWRRSTLLRSLKFQAPLLKSVGKLARQHRSDVGSTSVTVTRLNLRVPHSPEGAFGAAEQQLGLRSRVLHKALVISLSWAATLSA